MGAFSCASVFLNAPNYLFTPGRSGGFTPASGQTLRSRIPASMFEVGQNLLRPPAFQSWLLEALQTPLPSRAQCSVYGYIFSNRHSPAKNPRTDRGQMWASRERDPQSGLRTSPAPRPVRRLDPRENVCVQNLLTIAHQRSITEHVSCQNVSYRGSMRPEDSPLLHHFPVPRRPCIARQAVVVCSRKGGVSLRHRPHMGARSA